MKRLIIALLLIVNFTYPVNAEHYKPLARTRNPEPITVEIHRREDTMNMPESFHNAIQNLTAVTNLLKSLDGYYFLTAEETENILQFCTLKEITILFLENPLHGRTIIVDYKTEKTIFPVMEFVEICNDFIRDWKTETEELTGCYTW